MKRNLSALFAVMIVLMARPAQAVSIAIIDSGTDLSHPDLINKQWTNFGDPDDALDNDNNGYIDDTHGWNFAEQDNHLYEKKLVGSFSPDTFAYFDYQLKLLSGTATDADKEWLKTHRGDTKFMRELSTFANWMHGSHVAGIAAKDADKALIMPLKILPTPPKAIASRMEEQMRRFAPVAGTDDGIRKKLLLAGLKFLAQAQGKALAPVGQYVHDQKARVANCSFGTSTTAIKGLLKVIIAKVLGHDPTDEELTAYAGYFVNEIVTVMEKNFTGLAKETLFVIAAGNDGTNNDLLPASPANIKADNTITVAATYGYAKMASFSNYGAKTVDIAAPGVAIHSSIPGSAYLAVSGTSQAAPFIANMAGRIMDSNSRLTMKDTKRIMMETVDKKDFLADKVKSGGIANMERAMMAARLSNSMTVETAIEESRKQVRNLLSMMPAADDSQLTVEPLLTWFN